MTAARAQPGGRIELGIAGLGLNQEWSVAVLMRIFSVSSGTLIAKPLNDVFPFFSEARNLEELTPAWLRFQVLTPSPIEMAVGAKIDYRLRLRGIPISWQSEITAWEPPVRFVDQQRRGPYRLWIHEHHFREANGMTFAEDFVQYAVPGGWIANRLLVRRDMCRIFEYRREKLRQIFGPVPGSGPAA